MSLRQVQGVFQMATTQEIAKTPLHVNDPDYNEGYQWGIEGYYDEYDVDDTPPSKADVFAFVEGDLSPAALFKDEMISRRMGWGIGSYQRSIGFVCGWLAAYAQHVATQATRPYVASSNTSRGKIIPIRM